MTEQTIFENKDETPSSPEQQNPTPTTPAVPPELADWVGEGKKYKSVEEVYKAFPNAQTHISTLEQRVQEMEAELQKRKTAEELLNEIKTTATTTEQQKPTSQGVEVNERVLSELVERKLNERVTRQKQDENTGKVVDAFTQAFGDKKEESYAQIAKENGLTIEEMNGLAAKSPDLVIKLAGINKASGGSPVIKGDVNPLALGNNKQPEQPSYRVGIYYNQKETADAIRRIRQDILNKE